MKKILIALTIVISCLGINKVSANENLVELIYTDYHDHNGVSYYYIDTYSYLVNLGFSDELETMYHYLIEKYNNEYKENYPFFYISCSGAFYDKDSSNSINYNDIENVSMELHLYSSVPSNDGFQPPYSEFSISQRYDVASSTYIFSINDHSVGFTPILSCSHNDEYFYNELGYFISNFDIINNSDKTYTVPDINLTINPGDVIKPYYSVENAFQNNYIEINLNDYAYVALALKEQVPQSFETTVQVKGQYCITPIYNYGMSSYDSIVGTKVQNVCSPYYLNYTPVRTYITFDNFQNNAIYYVKAYNTEQENYIKVDTSVFDITYITEEDKDSPYVYVQGKYYPTIPYDELPSSATQNTEEGYIPGQVEEFSFADIFTAPLEFLEDIWDSIVSVFDLVKEFFSLLPEPIPTFLLSSFLLGLAIGLLKLIF